MGCGKSTALTWFADRGAVVFDTDHCVRRLYDEDESLHADLRKVFGEDVFRSGGKVDRAAIGSIVFADSSKLVALEKMVHPRVRASWLEELKKAHACLVVEIPLLFEKDLQSSFDLTCSVVSHPEVQHRRLLARGWSAAEIAARQQRQWSLEDKARRADVVFMNDGDRTHFEAQLGRFTEVYRIFEGITH